MALAFVLLGLALWSNWAQIRELSHRHLDPRPLGLAVLIGQFSLLLTFFRWWLLARVVEPALRWPDAILLGFIGNVFNVVIPGAVGGDMIKAAYLIRMGLNQTRGVASILIDRILGLLGLFLLAAISGGVAWPRAGELVRVLIVLEWSLLGIGLTALALLLARGREDGPGADAPSSEGSRIAKVLGELRGVSRAYHRHPGAILAGLAISTLSHALNVLGFYAASRMLFPDGLPSLAAHYLLVPLILFSTSVPLPLGALGFSEQVGAQLFRLVAHPSGALAMMGFRVLTYAGVLLSAGVYLTRIRQVRSLTETAERVRI
jgi:uncharacterized protein (TIRG00374 family)